MAQNPNSDDQGGSEFPAGSALGKIARGALQIAGGAIPFAGGAFSAAAGFWSEQEQHRINEFLRAWIKMLEEEMREKQQTFAEIVTRIDLQEEKIAQRVRSDEYQSLVRKAFRKWAGAESAKKREYIRNILSNAAATDLTSDAVVSLFLDWLETYSELHFSVIADIYGNPGTTRSEIWHRLGQGMPREDSAEADLFKLLFRDLSTGQVVRQHRETDYSGNFLAKQRPKKVPGFANDRRLKSAFDDDDQYELTALGQQFVHYAMQELTPKIEFHTSTAEGGDNDNAN